jgi:ribonuclease HI
MINIFTDGSAFKNGEKDAIGGYAIFFGDNDSRNFSKKLSGKITNNIAELKAILRGIKILITTKKIENEIINIYSDSEYAIKSITIYAKSWEKNKWKKSDGKEIKNLNIIKQIYNLINNLNFKINFIHTRAHQKAPSKDDPNYIIWYGNNQADIMAKKAALST